MKTFTVYASEVVTYCADVQANNMQEAKRLFGNGEHGAVEHLSNTNMQIDAVWCKTWGDNFPTEKECPSDVIKHHADACNIEMSEELLSFARAMWNEGNLS